MDGQQIVPSVFLAGDPTQGGPNPTCHPAAEDASAYSPLADAAGDRLVQEHIGTDSKERLPKSGRSLGSVPGLRCRPGLCHTVDWHSLLVPS